MRLKRPARRATLVVHVVSAASWLGLALGLLALGITAATTESAPVLKASVRSMKTMVDWLVFPVALLTLLTGLLMAPASNWGLARHRWIHTKFWLTLAMIAGTFFGFRDAIVNTYADVTAGHPLADAGDVLLGPMLSPASYVFMMTISILKPWGLTKRGRKLRAVSRRAVDEAAVRQPV
ncbi:DUF2269 domain-containing protein [Streptomyces sp. NPDC059352]|uniref:DUF2269 domain-containing protein n=1 Tax=Streptomyces sp. NPDC059352 TaxID=3346810 RepID=UPI0036C29253